MKIKKWLGLAVLATAVAGGVASKTTKYTGVAVEYSSWGVRKVADAVLNTTETVGAYTKEAGEFCEKQSQDLNKFAKDYLRKEEYRDLTEKNYDFSDKLVENGEWVLVN